MRNSGLSETGSSAGRGRNSSRLTVNSPSISAITMSPCCGYLRENFNGVRVQCGDFMEWQPVQYYSRVIMNPPFSHGQDIRHILRAFSLLRPGGVLVAVCLNGPRQQEKLLPFSDVREELPRGTFAYTDVPTMIIRLRA